MLICLKLWILWSLKQNFYLRLSHIIILYANCLASKPSFFSHMFHMLFWQNPLRLLTFSTFIILFFQKPENRMILSYYLNTLIFFPIFFVAIKYIYIYHPKHFFKCAQFSGVKYIYVAVQPLPPLSPELLFIFAKLNLYPLNSNPFPLPLATTIQLSVSMSLTTLSTF